MSPAPKNNIHWQSKASFAHLKKRAEILHQVREFFFARQVLEVETPLLTTTTVTDPYIKSFSVGDCFLQTSPEFAMKKLLASGSGSIYQICKAFRVEEVGKRHQVEFSLLEWYRLGFDHVKLMREVSDLLQVLLAVKPAKMVAYADLFLEKFNLNPHTATLDALTVLLQQEKISMAKNIEIDHDTALNLLMSYSIEPNLGFEQPIFVYDYPASFAALAKIRNDAAYPVAERFEVYVNGVELANGYHELCSADEQHWRFSQDNAKRRALGLAEVKIDETLLAALKHGLPNCAGVALGLDRLLMLATGADHIDQVISFCLEY